MPLSQELFNADDDSGYPTSDDVKWMSERHIACVFLLDTSDSMSGTPINELNKGIATFKDQILNEAGFDEHTKACIDVAFVTFGSDVEIVQDFVPVERMEVPILRANGMTCVSNALNLAMDMITERKRVYRELGTPYFRPWIFCIAGGKPNDDYLGAAEKLKEMERNKGVLGYCICTSTFIKDVMAQIFEKERVFELTDIDITSLFQFVSNSLGVIRNSDSAAGNDITVEAPHNLKLSF